MNKLALILSLLTAIRPDAKVEPWQRVECSGYVRSEEEFQLFGDGHKRLCLEMLNTHGWTYNRAMGFVSDADYKQAEKSIDQAVKVDGYLIRRGSEMWLVPVSLQEMRGK